LFQVSVTGRTDGESHKTPSQGHGRDDCPYGEQLTRKMCDLEKYRLQAEWLKFQYWSLD